MFDCKPLSTPYDHSVKLSKNRGKLVAQLKQSQIIGTLMHVMSCIKPDIAHAIARLSRYISSPNGQHWKVLD